MSLGNFPVKQQKAAQNSDLVQAVSLIQSKYDMMCKSGTASLPVCSHFMCCYESHKIQRSLGVDGGIEAGTAFRNEIQNGVIHAMDKSLCRKSSRVSHISYSNKIIRLILRLGRLYSCRERRIFSASYLDSTAATVSRICECARRPCCGSTGADGSHGERKCRATRPL